MKRKKTKRKDPPLTRKEQANLLTDFINRCRELEEKFNRAAVEIRAAERDQ